MKFVDPLRLPRRCRRAHLPPGGPQFYWRTFGWFIAGWSSTRSTACPARRCAGRRQPRRDRALARSGATRAAGSTSTGPSADRTSTAQRADARPEPPRDHADRPAARPPSDLPATRARSSSANRRSLVLAFLALVELSTLSRSGLLGLLVGLLVLAVPYRRFFLSKRFLIPLALVVARRRDRRRPAHELLLDGVACPDERRRRLGTGPPRDLRPAAAGDRPAPAFRARAEHLLGLLRVRDRQVELGAPLLYVALLTETGIVGTALFLGYIVYLFRRLGALRRLGRTARRRGRRGRRACAAARLGPDRSARRDARRRTPST